MKEHYFCLTFHKASAKILTYWELQPQLTFWEAEITTMKCILIISSLPDIIFIHADKAFIKHINKVSLKAGFIGEDHNEDEMDMTALSQIFSPMITSLTYMNDLGNPYSSILCEDGTLFVFSQVCISSSCINSISFCFMGGESAGENTSIQLGMQTWCIGESPHLSPMSPGFKSWTQCDMYTCLLQLLFIFVLALRVLLRVLWFPSLLHKN